MNNEHNFERYSSLSKLNNCNVPKNIKYFEKLFPALAIKKKHINSQEKTLKFLSKKEQESPIIFPNLEIDMQLDKELTKIHKNLETDDKIKILNYEFEEDQKNLNIQDIEINSELPLNENTKVPQDNCLINYTPIEDKYRNLFAFLNKVKLKVPSNKTGKESIKSVRQNSIIGNSDKERNDFIELKNRVVINFEPEDKMLQKGKCILPNINKKNKNHNRNSMSNKQTNPINEENPELQITLCINNIELSQNPAKLPYKNMILNKRKRIPTIIKKDRILINKTDNNLEKEKELIKTINTPKQIKLNTNRCQIIIKDEKSPGSQKNISTNDISSYQSLHNEEKRIKLKSKKLTSLDYPSTKAIPQIKTHIKTSKISDNNKREKNSNNNNNNYGLLLYNLILKMKEDNNKILPAKINIIHQDYTIHKYHFLNLVFELLNYFQNISIKNKDEFNIPQILFLLNCLNLPLTKKDINANFMKSKENVLPIKERLLKILYDSINYSNELGIQNTDQIASSFRANIGKGNNSSLIKNLLKQR